MNKFNRGPHLRWYVDKIWFDVEDSLTSKSEYLMMCGDRGFYHSNGWDDYHAREKKKHAEMVKKVDKNGQVRRSLKTALADYSRSNGLLPSYKNSRKNIEGHQLTFIGWIYDPNIEWDGDEVFVTLDEETYSV